MIDPATWERVKEIVAHAAALPPSEVERYVRESCADDESLLSEVRSLLEHASPAAPVDPPQVFPGAILADRYRVGRRLGAGGFAETWLAEDQQLHGRPVALKIPRRLDAADPWFDEKFRSEIQALSSLNHPGVVSPVGVGRLTDGRPFLVMEYVEGMTLREVLDTGGLSAARAAGILNQIGRALAAVQRSNIYHRDLKPENVMVQTLPDATDHVRLIDFGIATIMSREKAASVHTRAVGSPDYMAPEQLIGEPTPTTDVYAFGLVAREIISASRPSALKQRDVKELLARALNPVPEERPSDVGMFADQLARAMTSDRSPWLRPLVSGLLLTTVVVAIIFASRARQMPEPSPIEATNRIVTIRVITERAASDATIAGGSIVLARTDRFRLEIATAVTGHLYVFAESPDSAVLNILFPSPTANGGSSVVFEDKAQLIPEASWLEFEGSGVDRLWLAWSRDPEKSFEAARKWANPRARGQIADDAEKRRIQALLQPSATLRVYAERLMLSGTGPLLIGAVDVRHE